MAAVVGFNPEQIIADSVFYNGAAMSSVEIQTFLDQKIGRCTNGKCLNVAVVSVSSRDAWYSQATGDLVCNAFEGGTMPASELIYRIQVACGISAKVILVTLQKEQGLTTSAAPSDWNIQAAMGASCPDTAPCDPAFSGLGPQIVQGVRQMKIYKAGRFAMQPGLNFIAYNPNSACGGTRLNIRNYATAALYNYTPYQPNAAALAAGYGLGDGCSSYGNRNFYNYFKSWFGDPLASGPQSDIAYARNANPQLGAATTDVTCGLAGGGCRQLFADGGIFWMSSTGARVVEGGIWGLYQADGVESGGLGYPLDIAAWTDVNRGGWIQRFQNGDIHWSTVAGGRIVEGGVYSEFSRVGGVGGDLGWPMADYRCGLPRGGCIQQFQFGDVYFTAAGAVAIRGGMRETLNAMGGVTGTLGYPTGAEQHRTGNGEGWAQAFEGGAVYWRNGVGIHMFGGIRDEYVRRGFNNGSLGWPTGAQACAPDGCRQDFQGGLILWTPTHGTFVVGGGILETYQREGTQTGRLGYPIGAQTPRTGNGDGWVQAFQGGAIYWRNGVGISMWGGIREQYGRENYNWGRLGWPRSAQECGLVGGGCQQSFDGGRITWTPQTGTVTIAGKMSTAYDAAGGLSGTIGYATGPEFMREGNGRGLVQAFQNGAIYQRGSEAAHVMTGPIRAAYATQNYNWGTLGWPTTDIVCGLAKGGCEQQFDTGWIVWSSASGAIRIDGGIWETWQAMGGESGALGYPTGPAAVRSAGGWQQPFEGGTLAWTGDRGGFLE